MIVDCAASLAAVGGTGSPAALQRLPSSPATVDDRFVADLWLACGAAGPAWRVDPAAAGPLPGPGWRALLVTATVGTSPFAALRDLTAAGAKLPGPVACLTLGGAGLEGQHGRRWHAAPGNLHLSAALPCDLDAARCGPSLPMLAGVALAEAVEARAGTPAAGRHAPGLTWVNDLVVGGDADGWRKLGGVLTAMRTSGARVTTVFVGVGLNLVVAPPLPEEPFALAAAALADVIAPPDAAAAPSLGAAALAVLSRLRVRLDELAAHGPTSLVESYRARSIVVGREVEVWDASVRAGARGTGLPPPRRRGVVVEILPDLGLVLEGQDEPVRDGCLRLGRRAGNP